ncbi:hypothetical protein [Xylanivirga thermophila]|uniref:hypothetical protein n=1 Tax=Xylanivirga thermophila TaxID=2496273 RepID=UPI00101D26D7|nr:hypothetical protein [Xylanivirga thermophila]
MKDFYRLLNYEIRNIFKFVLVICILAIISPIVFLNISIKDGVNLYQPFEFIYASSGCVILFVIYLALMCLTFIYSIYSNYFGSKSIYTLLTLPIRRELVYLSKLISFFISFAAFLSAQLISILLGYWFVASRIAALEEGKYLMTNGLFLSFVRSDFLRIIFPLGLESAVSTISLFTTLLCGLYYGALCERSRRYWGFFPIGGAVFIMISLLNYRINQRMYVTDYRSMYLQSLVLFLFSVFFVWHSIKIFKKSAVAE